METEKWFAENMKDQKRPISASSIVDGLRCERLFFYKNRWAIQPKVRPYSKGASTGTLVHRLMKAGKDRIGDVQQQVIKDHSRLVDRIKAGEDLTGDLARAANDLNHLYQKALAIVTIFWDRFPQKDYITTICREERIETTQGLMKPYPPDGHLTVPVEVPVVWIADWIVRDERDGSIWIRDTKTTGESFDSILTGYLYSVQCRFYRVMADLKKWGDKVKGFIIDMVMVPTIKLCGKDEKMAAKLGCTPFEAYVQRVKEWYEVQPEECMKSAAIVFNGPVWSPELLRNLDVVSNLWGRSPRWPSNFHRDTTGSRCYHYRKVCPYYPLCSSGESAWPSLIEQYYEVREPPREKEKA